MHFHYWYEEIQEIPLIDDPVFISYFNNAPPQRRGEMVEYWILQHFKQRGYHFIPFEGGFKATFDAFDRGIDTSRSKHVSNYDLWETELYMKHNIHGPSRDDELLVDVKYTDDPKKLFLLNDLTRLQRIFRRYQHCRWIRCTKITKNGIIVGIKYVVIDTMPLDIYRRTKT